MKEIMVAQLPRVRDGVPTQMWLGDCRQLNILTRTVADPPGGCHVHPVVENLPEDSWYASKDPETLIVVSGWVRLICWSDGEIGVYDLDTKTGPVQALIPLGVAHLTVVISDSATMLEPMVTEYDEAQDHTVKIPMSQLPPKVIKTISEARALVCKRRYPYLANPEAWANGRLRMPVDEGCCGGSPPVYVAVAGP